MPLETADDINVQDAGFGMTTWQYGYDSGNGEYQQLDAGNLPRGTVDPTPGSVNFLALTVYKGVAILSGNTLSAVAVIPLQGSPITGDIKSRNRILFHSEWIEGGPWIDPGAIVDVVFRFRGLGSLLRIGTGEQRDFRRARDNGPARFPPDASFRGLD